MTPGPVTADADGGAPTVLALDQGTSATKALVVRDGRVLAQADCAVDCVTGPAGAVEVDPEQLWHSVVAAGREAVARAGTPIDAVALANQGETVLAWDRMTGRPCSAAISWQDRRSEGVCAELFVHAEELSRRTGLVLDPYFSAPKMTWLRREVSAGVITTSDSFLLHRMTGEFVTDITTASRSLLTDLSAPTWQPDLCELFGLAGELLPRIVANDEIIGSTSLFGPSVPVAGVVVDQQAALFGQGCLAPGDMKCTFGTGAFLLANAGSNARPTSGGLSISVAWRIRGCTQFCVDGQVYTAGSAIRWLVELGLLPGADDLDAVAAADPGQVLCVPAFAGLAAPWWQPEATGVFTGLRQSTGRAELVAAVVYGIAAQVAVLARAFDTGAGPAGSPGGPERALKVDGGLTRSAAVLQAVADVLQVPVQVAPTPDATALGAAALAWLALDPARSATDVLGEQRPARVVTPRWHSERAADFLHTWCAAADFAARSGTGPARPAGRE